MKTEHFDKMINYYKGLKDEAGSFETVELSGLPVTKYNEVIQSARDCLSKLDCFNTDLYHIIGMARLSASQLAKFTKLACEIEAHRSSTKFVASQQLVQIQKQKPTSVYALKCGLTLSNKLKGE